MLLVTPRREHLASYVDALRRSWSPDTQRDVSAELIAEIEQDPDAFLGQADDRDPAGRTVTLPDGTGVPRLPGFSRWMWDGEFAGSINARWSPGTEELPPYCLGHIGYAVVPWKQRRGYATEALRQLLDELRLDTDLRYVDITTDVDNVASQRVVEANGGVLLEPFVTPESSGSHPALRFRVDLS